MNLFYNIERMNCHLKISLTSVLFLIGMLLCGSLKASSSTDSIFSQLDYELNTKDVYDRQKEKRILNLKNAYLQVLKTNNLSRQFHFSMKLYDEYKSYQYDSAYVYAEKMYSLSKELGDKSKENESQVKIGFILLSSGKFKETFDILAYVNAKKLSDNVKLEYYSLMMRANFDLAAYNNDKKYAPGYKAQANVYIDSAIAISVPGSYDNLYLVGYKNLANKNFAAAERNFLKLLKTNTLTEHQKAIVSSTLSNIYINSNDRQKGLDLLAYAAISDIRSSTKETLAIYWLAEFSYKNGDVKNAYKFIQEALSNAEFYGARQRQLQINSVLPIVAADKLNFIEQEKELFLKYLVSMCLLALLVIIISFILFRQLKKLKAKEKIIEDTNIELGIINGRLTEDAHIKEEYIGYFFDVISSYIEKLEKIKRTVDMKLSVRKYDDIQLIVNNIQVKKEREKLFHTFDRVFLKIFPNFIESFNSMFKPEDQIWPKDNEVLTTDLRIFALIRLGISDNERIANILEYTEKTIYVYKMRLKAKSICPSDQFDQKIMKIEAANIGGKTTAVTQDANILTTELQ